MATMYASSVRRGLEEERDAIPLIAPGTRHRRSGHAHLADVRMVD
jgi:hypothetical protein